MEQLQIVKFIKPLRGSSRPYLALVSDGNYYVVTLRGNPEGDGILANELLASRLAEIVGLEVPRAEVLELHPAMATSLQPIAADLQWGIAGSKHVGSRLAIAPSEGQIFDVLPPAYAAQLSNPEQLAGIQLFDIWTGNRGKRQVAYRRRTGERWAAAFVDNGHCFGGPGWDQWVGLAGGGVTLGPEQESWLGRIGALTRGTLLRTMAEIPPEWYGEDASRMLSLATRLGVRQAELRAALPARNGGGLSRQDTILLVEDEESLRDAGRAVALEWVSGAGSRGRAAWARTGASACGRH